MVSYIDQILTSQPPEFLYQYTSFAGLLGIAKSKSIWATNIHYLNDEQEFAYGLETVRQVIRERQTNATAPAEAELLEKLTVHVGTIVRTNIFVASFSEVPDLLSQWRGYCPNGKGVSIGFYSEDLAAAAKRYGFRLVRAVYELGTARGVAGELIDAAFAYHRKRPAVDLDTVATEFTWRLSGVAPALKHETFAEEKEWRLVSPMTSIKHPQLRIRETAGRLVPYFDVELTENDAPLRLGHICVGPASDRARAFDGAYDALNIHRVDFQGMRPSRVPYRE